MDITVGIYRRGSDVFLVPNGGDGLTYCGTMSWTDAAGACVTPTDDAAAEVLLHAAPAFVKYLRAQLAEDDLERLYLLPDPRGEDTCDTAE